MKKLKLLVTICFLVASVCTLDAQGLYVRAGLGYGMGTTKDAFGMKIDNYGSENQSTTQLFTSLGGGLNGHLGIGYMFSPNFGIDIAGLYLLGSRVLVDEKTNGSQYDRSESYTRQLRVIPSLVVDAGLEKISPYARLGLVVPVAGASYGERESNAPEFVSTIIPAIRPDATGFEAKSVAKGALSIGIKTSLGINYNLNESLAIYGELAHTNLRIKRASYEVEKAELSYPSQDNEDVISLLSLGGAYAYTEYQNELSTSELEKAMGEDNYGTKDNPALAITEDANFNAFGINIGIKFSF